MKSSAYFQHRPYSPANDRPALGRIRDPGEDLEKGRLSCAIPTNDTDDIALLHFKTDISERPNRFMVIADRRPVIRPLAKRPSHGIHNAIPQGLISATMAANPILLAQLFHGNYRVTHAHTTSAKVLSVRRK